MKSEQLSQRIGNIDDRLIEQAENVPDFGRARRIKSIRRAVSLAAVVALMACSFAIGAYALYQEPETVYIEVQGETEIVYVETGLDIVKVGDSGISLIFPESWKGKYGYELDEDGVRVHHLATRESFERNHGYPGGGHLFGIWRIDGRYPMDYIYPTPGYTIAVADTCTYLLSYPSDVQIDVNDPVSWAEYDELLADIKTVEIVMTAEMLVNTTNASNWVAGTVYINILGNEWIVDSIVCNEEDSALIAQIIENLDFSVEQNSFYSDLRIMFNREEYYMNLETGQIMNAYGGSNSAVLSTEDLSTIMDIIH